MAKPITPLVACDVFVQNDQGKILLVKRVDDGTWCMPGGCQDLGETPAECAVRECREESGYLVEILGFLGVFSSRKYQFVHYKWKDDVFVHLLFRGRVVGGAPRLSDETSGVDWFPVDKLPLLLDDHERRIGVALERIKNPSLPAYYE